MYLKNFICVILFGGILNQGETFFLKPYNANEIYCYGTYKPISNRRHVILYDLVEDSHFLPMLCLYERTRDQSILLLKDTENTKEKPTEKTVVFAHFSPNLILITGNMSSNILSLPIMDSLFRSHRSFVVIIVTIADDFYKCNNGEFSKQAYLEIEHFMNILWHKYFMFQVTLELPFVCPNFHVIYGSKTVNSNQGAYNRTIQTVPVHNIINFYQSFNSKVLAEGFPIRANIFERFPTSIKMCKNIHYYIKINFNLTQNFCGLDAIIMQEVLSRLKFNTTFPDVDDKDGYGYYVNDNNITGSLGHLVRRSFDVSFNSRFLTKYIYGDKEDEIKFLHYVGLDSVCCVMKVPDYEPLWNYPYSCFSPQVWAIIFTLLILIAVTAKGTAALKKKVNLDARSLHFIDYITIGLCGWMLCPKKRFISILNATCLLMCIIILSLYQGHINYLYTMMVRKHGVNTIQDLIDYKVEIFSSPSILSTVGGLQAIPIPSSRMHVVYYNISNLLIHDNTASLQRKSDIQLETAMYYTTDDGTPLLDVVNECFGSQYLSYIARNDFPFGKDIRILIIRLVEAGMPDTYYRWTKNSLGLRAYSEHKEGPEPRPFSATTMQEQWIAFAFLLAGYFTSFCTFIIESWWWNRINKVTN